MIVETAYPWTLNWVDNNNNIMNANAQGPVGYPITREGQRDFLIDLSQEVHDHLGMGVIYWEPGWVSSGACTQWAPGSSWENACFFDFENNNEALPAFDYFGYNYDGLTSVNEISESPVPNFEVLSNLLAGGTPLQLKTKNNVEISLKDLNGQSLVKYDLSASDEFRPVYLPDLPNGIYLLYDGLSGQVEKILIQR
jgi:hypothetical protein